MADRALVLIVASGAAWEPAALRRLADHPGIVVLKRCVDVDDLLAAATAGQADVAVLGLDAPGLDRAAVDLLRKHGVRPVAIAPGGPTLDGGRLRAARIGVHRVVTDDDLDRLPESVLAEESPATAVRPLSPPPLGPPPDHPRSGPPVEPAVSTAGRVLAVWGPAGAPGRTTVASTEQEMVTSRSVAVSSRREPSARSSTLDRIGSVVLTLTIFWTAWSPLMSCSLPMVSFIAPLLVCFQKYRMILIKGRE